MTNDLEIFSNEFSSSLEKLILEVFGYSAVVRSTYFDGKISIRGGEKEPIAVPLLISKVVVARLKFKYDIKLDSQNKYPAVHKSEFHLLSATSNRPVIRYEYVREYESSPTAHWHIHGESTELGRILSRGKQGKSTLSELHLPVGGSRFRPCLEDFIEFLIKDLGIDCAKSWKKAIEEGREKWKKIQTAAVVRDSPEIAASTLKNLGYGVTPPLPH